ncbi:MAG TPA: alpha/beta fold hydrolase [Burkholderiales bacterium]|nr:alpha/beta fold hydrolase [Burkholderiales bacterium]
MSAQPFFREAGSGAGVVCIHSNASSSGQWRALMDLLAPRFHILAADTYGAGKSPPWPRERKVSLRDEVELLDPVFARAGERFSLVGHSYGGGIALIAAIVQRHRLRAMALFEPSLFAVVEQESASPNDVDGIRGTVAAAVTALEAGDAAGAARCFIDFWMGQGSFDRMPERVRAATADSVKDIQGWKDALFDEPTPLKAFAELDFPVLLMAGTKSPLSSRAVVRRLARVLPKVEVVELEGLGHMGPVTHPDVVNARIAAFLDQRGR